MANKLKMDKQATIRVLLEQGWGNRRIARELGIDRRTVGHYRRKCQQEGGSECTGVLTGTVEAEDAKCTGVLTGTQGTGSKCEVLRDWIIGELDKGLNAQRIYQDLLRQKGFEGAYDTVQRFVKKLRGEHPERVWRMEVEPAQEAQVDYGTMSILDTGDGKLCKVHLLRVTLSHSRKSYTEAVMHQSTESFIRSLENAFLHFGGVAQRLCLDNLKAAVTKADWYEPEVHPKLTDFARHYGLVIMPTRPYTPEHKGKIESGIKYVKGNALKGKRFSSLQEINEHLRWWEEDIADKRIHGTTRKQVEEHFLKVEKPVLGRLPQSLFPCYTEGLRSVHRDSYVEVGKSYYEVPQEYIGHKVWARWDGYMVRIYDLEMRPIRVYRRLEAGQFSEVLGVEGARHSVEQSTIYYRNRVVRLGKECADWADGAIAAEPHMAIRRMQGLLHLRDKCSLEGLRKACARAASQGQYKLRDIRNQLGQPNHQQTFTYLEEHELIRDIQYYGNIAGTFSENSTS